MYSKSYNNHTIGQVELLAGRTRDGCLGWLPVLVLLDILVESRILKFRYPLKQVGGNCWKLERWLLWSLSPRIWLHNTVNECYNFFFFYSSTRPLLSGGTLTKLSFWAIFFAGGDDHRSHSHHDDDSQQS